MTAVSTAGAHSAPVPQLTEVADDVYAYIQPQGGWCLNNAGVLAGSDGTVVIDTVATASRAARLRESVERIAAGPVRTLVNTHHHGDHTFGNDAFGAVTIVAHRAARTEMAASGLGLTTMWPQVDWGEVRLALPTLTFEDRLTLHVDDRRAELIHVGPAHTTNDVVVWLPGERVLFAGDVVMSGATPFNLMGSISGALRAVAELRQLGAQTVVCGHGPVAGPEVFDETTTYLKWIQALAAHGAARRLSPLQAAQEAELGAFGHLIDAERIVGNLHRAYAEIAGGELGRPLDVVTIFGEMIEYNGGALPECR
ncbi:MAG: MBL fold metallo-hydrolase, partial [Actinobacteria bacterium]|nr:MBL fold metallo-hydrolase [Actinomycetota bacterium]